MSYNENLQTQATRISSIINTVNTLPGQSYTLTESDKSAIAELVAQHLSSETWTFTLANGSVVTKAVYIDG